MSFKDTYRSIHPDQKWPGILFWQLIDSEYFGQEFISVINFSLIVVIKFV